VATGMPENLQIHSQFKLATPSQISTKQRVSANSLSSILNDDILFVVLVDAAGERAVIRE